MKTLDLLIVGGLTLDRIGGVLRPGGAVLFAAEGAAAAGLRVGVLTTAGAEDGVPTALRRLRVAAEAVECLAGAATTTFTHQTSGPHRRLTLDARGGGISDLGPAAAWRARAVLLAPVAGEVSPEVGREAAESVRPEMLAVAAQGWLRRLGVGDVVSAMSLSEVAPDVIEELRRGVDLVVASTEDLGLEPSAAAAGVGRLRATFGARPEIAVTAATSAVVIHDRRSRTIPLARVVETSDTTGAGDAFAALLAARRGAGETLEHAARGAMADVASYLEWREGG